MKQSTATFYESAPVVVGSKSIPTSRVSTYVEELADIKAFLAKPLLIAKGEWTTSQVANTQLEGHDIATELTTNPIWADKIRGFNMIRGDFILRVEINASPFQQGKLLLHYLPCYDEFISQNAAFPKRANKLLSQKVQHPHVELNCDKSSVLMRVPYVTPSQYFSVDDGRYTWGSWFLDVFSPLKTGSAAPTAQTTVSYLVYGYWENIELIAPVYKPQSGKREVVNRTRMTEERENEGPITQGLRAIGTISNSLSNVPLLHDYAKRAEWASDIMANMAHTLGWSKPRELTGVGVNSLQTLRYAGTVDGPSVAVPGGAKCDNSLCTLDYASYTNEDEMAFEYLYKIPFFAGLVSWTSEMSAGEILSTTQVSPSRFYASVTDTVGSRSVTYRQYAPFGYLSNFFRQWRGGIKMTIKFIKTKMHTGKIEINFNPGPSAYKYTDIDHSQYCLRAIVDIKNEDEVTLVLPYLCYSDYLDVGEVDESNSGVVRIMVLNELKGPETVSQSIDFQLFFSAAEDFELAVPSCRFPTLVPYLPQSNNSELVEQMHGGIGNTPITDDVIGKAAVDSHPVFHSERCIGEKLLSVKQLMLRNTLMANIKVGQTFPGTGYMRPHYLPAFTIKDGTTISNPPYGGDMMGFMAPMYAFYRGSVNITITDVSEVYNTHFRFSAGTSLAPDTGEPIGSHVLAPQNLISAAPTVASTQVVKNPTTNNTVSTSYLDAEKVIYQHIPYYNRFPFSLTTQYSGISIENLKPEWEPHCQLGWTILGTTFPLLQRAVGDDFRCHFFIGCPPVAWTVS